MILSCLVEPDDKTESKPPDSSGVRYGQGSPLLATACGRYCTPSPTRASRRSREGSIDNVGGVDAGRVAQLASHQDDPQGARTGAHAQSLVMGDHGKQDWANVLRMARLPQYTQGALPAMSSKQDRQQFLDRVRAHVRTVAPIVRDQRALRRRSAKIPERACDSYERGTLTSGMKA